jgi:ribosomal protein S18 acetylase RimI-like enzyme
MEKLNDTENGIAVRVDGDSALLVNRNTTVGYAQFSRRNRTLDYIFVNPAFRRQGHARRLMEICAKECGCDLCAALPISPLGQRFCDAVGLPTNQAGTTEATGDAV